jgi:hypothetical protein
MIFGLIEKQPSTLFGSTTPNIAELRGCEQLARCPNNRPQHGIKALLWHDPFPLKAAICERDSRVRSCLLHCGVKDCKRSGWDAASLYHRREERVESFTKANGMLQDRASSPSRRISELLQALCFSGADYLCLLSPTQQIGIAVQKFLRSRAGTIVNGVGEIQAEIPSRKLKNRL